MKLAQFKSPKTKPCPPFTNLDWAKRVKAARNRPGIPVPRDWREEK